MKKTGIKINNSFVIAMLKGALIATATSLVGILFFAFIIKLFGVSDGAIKPVNQIIKAISILIGVLFGCKKYCQKGLMLGLAIGIAYTILAFVIFSALNGNFAFDKTLLNDILFGGIMGAICGVAIVNFMCKSKNRVGEV